jgi:nicotinamidase-related amidase
VSNKDDTVDLPPGHWRTIATEEDTAAWQKGGFGTRCGFGDKPAVLVIDMTNGYVDPKYAKGGGAYPERAVSAVAQLLTSARTARLPVFYFRPSPQTPLSAAMRARKNKTTHGSQMLADPTARLWPDAIAPAEGDIIIDKPKSSPFFDTPLHSSLTFLGVDTVILCGLSTSGCIQAAALDACSSNLRAIVPEECVGDRAPSFHQFALYNIDMRYGDVMPLSEVLNHLHRNS